jgi:hypothetical protein
MSFWPGGRLTFDEQEGAFTERQGRERREGLSEQSGPPLRPAAGALMDDGIGRDPVSFLGRRLPPSFELRVIAVAPGRERAYDEAEWRDALVVVERGEIEIECLGGTRRGFRCGDVLWLTGLPLVALHNHGREPAVLVAVSRRGGPGVGRL